MKITLFGLKIQIITFEFFINRRVKPYPFPLMSSYSHIMWSLDITAAKMRDTKMFAFFLLN